MTGFEPATPCPPDRCATRLRHIPLLFGRSSNSLLCLFFFPSSVLEDGIGRFSLLAMSSLFSQKLIDLLDVGPFAGPLNDSDKVTSVSSM